LFRLTRAALENTPDKLLYLFAKHGQKQTKGRKKQLKGLKKLNPSSEAPITLIFFYVETDETLMPTKILKTVLFINGNKSASCQG
jgi:hypothetical protein